MKKLGISAAACAASFFSLGSAQAQFTPVECQSLDDLYLAGGCVVQSQRTYSHAGTGAQSSPGRVVVHAFVGADGVRSPDLAIVGGGYDLKVPGGVSVPPQAALGTIPVPARDALDAAGVDIVYVDFAEDNDNFAQAKSYALQDTLLKIGGWRASQGDDNDMIYIGLSLGGVVGRHALRSLELDGYDHGIRAMFTWDSPHRGANVSLALQAMPAELARGLRHQAARVRASIFGLGYIFLASQWRALDSFADEVEAIYTGMIGTPAAQQLIINSQSEPNLGMHPYGTQLHAELQAMGMPELSHNVAVAAGGIYQNPANNQRKPRFFELDGSMSGLTASFDAWRDDGNPYLQSYVAVTSTAFESQNSRSGSLETVPCSTISLPAVFSEFLYQELQSRGFNFNHWSNYQTDSSVYDSEACFVPTLSSTGVTSVDILNHNIPSLTELEDLSPFDELYAGHAYDFDHNSTAYWVFQDSFQQHLNSTYGSGTPEDRKASAGLPCNPESGSGGYGGFGFHNGRVTNTNNFAVQGWEVFVNFGQGVVPAPGWSAGGSFEVMDHYVRIYGTEVLQPGQSHYFSFGGNYSGPTNISLSCF